MSTSNLIFSKFLKELGMNYVEKSISNMTIFVIHEYKIPHGKYSGRVIGIGLPIPSDFPNVPPYGFHVRCNHGFSDEIPSRNTSDLGSDWEFWSREIRWDDPEQRTPRYYMDQINRCLELD